MTKLEQNIKTATAAANELEKKLCEQVLSAEELAKTSKELSEAIGTCNFLSQIKVVVDQKKKKDSRIVTM